MPGIIKQKTNQIRGYYLLYSPVFEQLLNKILLFCAIIISIFLFLCVFLNHLLFYNKKIISPVIYILINTLLIILIPLIIFFIFSIISYKYIRITSRYLSFPILHFLQKYPNKRQTINVDDINSIEYHHFRNNPKNVKVLSIEFNTNGSTSKRSFSSYIIDDILHFIWAVNHLSPNILGEGLRELEKKITNKKSNSRRKQSEVQPYLFLICSHIIFIVSLTILFSILEFDDNSFGLPVLIIVISFSLTIFFSLLIPFICGNLLIKYIRYNSHRSNGNIVFNLPRIIQYFVSPNYTYISQKEIVSVTKAYNINQNDIYNKIFVRNGLVVNINNVDFSMADFQSEPLIIPLEKWYQRPQFFSISRKNWIYSFVVHIILYILIFIYWTQVSR